MTQYREKDETDKKGSICYLNEYETDKTWMKLDCAALMHKFEPVYDGFSSNQSFYREVGKKIIVSIGENKKGKCYFFVQEKISHILNCEAEFRCGFKRISTTFLLKFEHF